MISIVDYGLGNLRAFENIYKQMGIPVRLAHNAEDIMASSKLILPGVGAFDWALIRLKDSGMLDTLNYAVLEKKVPVLGVCVGMQIMANSSDEGSMPGLSWIDGEVKHFKECILDHSLPMPHMGWNTVEISSDCELFKGLSDPKYYFLHSYYLSMKSDSDIIGISTYGRKFTSAIKSGNIYATQFHPEKSHHWGHQLLKNFAVYC